MKETLPWREAPMKLLPPSLGNATNEKTARPRGSATRGRTTANPVTERARGHTQRGVPVLPLTTIRTQTHCQWEVRKRPNSEDETMLSTRQQVSRLVPIGHARPHPRWQISESCARLVQRSSVSEQAIHRYALHEESPRSPLDRLRRFLGVESMNPRFRTNSTRGRSTQSRRERSTSLGVRAGAMPRPDATLTSPGDRSQPCETNQPSISLSGTIWRARNARRSRSAAGNIRSSPKYERTRRWTLTVVGRRFCISGCSTSRRA